MDKNTERILKNLTLEIRTIDVLAGHILSDLRDPNPAKLNAARHLCESIQAITATYR